MLSDIFTVFGIIVAALVVYRFRHAIVRAIRRFDARNAERIAEQEAERHDPVAHFKHTLRAAEEQVEAVSEITVADTRLGTPVTRYLFEGQQFGARWEAENARAAKVRAIARNYYVELPQALAERASPESVRGSANPAPRNPSNTPSAESNVVPFRRGNETLH
ncbi:MAG: hypothetical protein JSR60_04400 [Proteobacteria bacterium]|nr:hypothetical protein [Pseudomonadota bacterium]